MYWLRWSQRLRRIQANVDVRIHLVDGYEIAADGTGDIGMVERDEMLSVGTDTRKRQEGKRREGLIHGNTSVNLTLSHVCCVCACFSLTDCTVIQTRTLASFYFETFRVTPVRSVRVRIDRDDGGGGDYYDERHDARHQRTESRRRAWHRDALAPNTQQRMCRQQGGGVR